MTADINNVSWKDTMVPTDHTFDQFLQIEAAFKHFIHIYVNTVMERTLKNPSFKWPALDDWRSTKNFVARTIRFAKPSGDPIYWK